MFAKTGHQPASHHDGSHDRRQRVRREVLVFCLVAHVEFCAKTDGKGVPLAYLTRIAYDWHQAIIDGVAEIGSGKALRQHGVNSSAEDHGCGNLHRRTAAEIFPRDKQIARLHTGSEFRVDSLQQVGAQYFRVQAVALAAR